MSKPYMVTISLMVEVPDDWENTLPYRPVWRTPTGDTVSLWVGAEINEALDVSLDSAGVEAHEYDERTCLPLVREEEDGTAGE